MKKVIKVNQVRNKTELKIVFDYILKILPKIDSTNNKYTLEFWENSLQNTPELLLFIQEEHVPIGFAFGWVENDKVTLAHLGVDLLYRGKGLGEMLVNEFEKNVKKIGYDQINLGSLNGKEGFYSKLGYKGTLLVQSEKHSIEYLMSLDGGENVVATNIYEGYVNQIFVHVSSINYEEMKDKYMKKFPGCYGIIMFSKQL